MAESKQYRTAVGFVQFPVEERDVNGQTVRDVTIRAVGSEGPYIRITVWEELADVEVEEGDLIAVDGPFEARVGQTQGGDTRTFLNLSARRLAVLGHEAPRAEREVKTKRGSKRKSNF